MKQVPELSTLSQDSQKTLNDVQKGTGMMPNVFKYIGHSINALKGYLVFNRTKSDFTEKEGEVINLVTSQIRGCKYCLSAHTGIAKRIGYTDEEILQIRKVDIKFDAKLNALAQMVAESVKNNGKVSEATDKAFYEAGYTETNLVDMMLAITKISFTNFVNNYTEVPIDFPVAPEL